MNAEHAISKHTPGPWHLMQEAIDKEWHILVSERGGRVIANIHIETGNETDAANARLIAAAPDLLAALREIADICVGPAETRNKLAHAVRESALAALAKAQGGAA